MKFEVGKRYNVCNLYSESSIYECVSRTETHASFTEIGFEDSLLVKEIEIENGDEVALYWEYKGHTCHIRSNPEFE